MFIQFDLTDGKSAIYLEADSITSLREEFKEKTTIVSCSSPVASSTNNWIVVAHPISQVLGMIEMATGKTVVTKGTIRR